jgi:hypothetical protein
MSEFSSTDMLYPLLQALISVLFLLLVFGTLEHGLGNKRGKLPRKKELLLNVQHAIFNQVVTRWLSGVAVLALAVADSSGAVSAQDAHQQSHDRQQRPGWLGYEGYADDAIRGEEGSVPVPVGIKTRSAQMEL